MISGVSTSWLLQATRLDVVPGSAAVVDDFAVAADGVATAAERILDQFKPDIVFLLNGLFAAERAFRAVALDRGLTGADLRDRATGRRAGLLPGRAGSRLRHGRGCGARSRLSR